MARHLSMVAGRHSLRLNRYYDEASTGSAVPFAYLPQRLAPLLATLRPACHAARNAVLYPCAYVAIRPETG